MRRRITLSTLRRMTVAEETMLRATMPRTSAVDTEPLRPTFAPTALDWARAKLVAPLTATVAERSAR